LHEQNIRVTCVTPYNDNKTFNTMTQQIEIARGIATKAITSLNALLAARSKYTREEALDVYVVRNELVTVTTNSGNVGTEITNTPQTFSAEQAEAIKNLPWTVNGKPSSRMFVQSLDEYFIVSIAACISTLEMVSEIPGAFDQTFEVADVHESKSGGATKVRVYELGYEGLQGRGSQKDAYVYQTREEAYREAIEFNQQYLAGIIAPFGVSTK